MTQKLLLVTFDRGGYEVYKHWERISICIVDEVPNMHL